MPAAEWLATFGPFDDEASRWARGLDLTKALRDGRPAHADFCIRSTTGEEYGIEASALPIVGPTASSRGR